MTAKPSVAADEPLRIGISSCLLGKPVRYDGGHKRDDFLVDVLGPQVRFVPVCPEVEIGLGTPRETIRLERRDGEVRLVMPKTGDDLTETMRAYSRRRVARLAREDLDGYVLKKNSPSCGMERVKIHVGAGPPLKTGRGLFAEELLRACPHLPVEEEGRLQDSRLRENFIERVFAYRRLRRLFTGRWSVGDLVRFHTAHKLTLLAHDPVAYRALGALVAQGAGMPRADLRSRYESGFTAALQRLATTRKHADVLAHMAGYFKRQLDPDAKRELHQVIDDYRRGLVPRIVPLTLLRHHVRRFGVEYLAGQVYLDPHPKELMLLNHV